jgi:GntR family transcriptional regulator
MSNKRFIDYRRDSLSERILHDLEKRIRTSAFKPGEKLPPEPELASMLGVSRNSLREAVKTLQYSGLLIRRRGIGTFVTAQHLFLNVGIEQLTGIAQFIKAQGFKSASKVKRFEFGIRNQEALVRLDLEGDHELFMIETVKYANSNPVAVCIDYVPMEVIGSRPKPEVFSNSIFEGLERHSGVDIRFAECEIFAVAAEPTQAKDLELRPGTPLLLLDQVHFDASEKKVLYSKTYFPSEKLIFRVIRKRATTTRRGERSYRS